MYRKLEKCCRKAIAMSDEKVLQLFLISKPTPGNTCCRRYATCLDIIDSIERPLGHVLPRLVKKFNLSIIFKSPVIRLNSSNIGIKNMLFNARIDMKLKIIKSRNHMAFHGHTLYRLKAHSYVCTNAIPILLS